MRAAKIISLCLNARGSRCGLDGAGLTGDRLRLARYPATALRNFHPLSAAPPFLAEQESVSTPPSTLFRPEGAVRSSPAFETAIEAALERPD